MAVALLSDRPGSLLICNGYKDAAYMELVCPGHGHTIVLQSVSSGYHVCTCFTRKCCNYTHA
jgi:arginine decarboxylase-like protein